MTATGGTPTGMIDVHAHAIFPSTEGAAGPYGPEAGVSESGQPFYRVGEYQAGTNYRGTPFADLEMRLDLMDRSGIDLQVLSPNPLTFYHGIEAEHAISFTRAVNDAIAGAVDAHPSRFRGTAALPMQDPKAAVRELQRAVRELRLSGAYVGTDFGDIADPQYDDLLHALVEHDVPLFFHPSSTGGAGLADDPRLRDRDMGLMVGYAYEEAITIARLVFSDVFLRHPDLDVVMSHGGGSMAWVYGKIRTAAANRPWVPEHVRELGIDPYLRRIWYDVHVGDRLTRDFLQKRVGTERLLFGTNFAGWDSGAGRDEGDLAPVLTANARRLLRLDDAKEAPS